MKIVIDTDAGRLMLADANGMRDLALYSTEGLAALKQLMDQIGERQGSSPAAFSPTMSADATQPLMLISVGSISPSLSAHLAKSWRVSLIVVGPDSPGHEGSEPILRISGEIMSAETRDQLRAAIPAGAKSIVALRMSPDKMRARQELEACAEFVSVNLFLAVSGDEAASPPIGQLEQPAAVTEFAMEHGEFRLIKSPVPTIVQDAGGFWLQRVK